MTTAQTNPEHAAALQIAIDLEEQASGLEAALAEVRAQAQNQRAYADALGEPSPLKGAEVVERLSAGLAAELSGTLAALPPREQTPLRAAAVAAFLASTRVETMEERELLALRDGLGSPPRWSRAHAIGALTSAALSRAMADADGLRDGQVETDRRLEAPPRDEPPHTPAAAPGRREVCVRRATLPADPPFGYTSLVCFPRDTPRKTLVASRC
ncbi:hypothetical protein [Nannocystis bainbridge]|uniref:DUF222 domain-containing protein n=1 Tax=Nannocystis bainbridge TaxID=2995303 RepID=A0ABT5E5H1_9BACT|nr:hypothetical protein [Nannocystis bainbridge]MDC0720688.1 hypothetical protein [Nannocystis bainbridge]